MRTIFAEYTPQRYSIDIYTNVGYMLRIDCWEAEKDLNTNSICWQHKNCHQFCISGGRNIFIFFNCLLDGKQFKKMALRVNVFPSSYTFIQKIRRILQPYIIIF